MPLSDTLRQANHDLWERTVTHPFVQEMGVSPEEYQSAQVLPTGMAMASFMLVTAYDGTFDDIVTALLVTEWTYRDWATRLAQADKKPPQKMYREWIDIHAAQELGDFVAALRRHVDDAITRRCAATHSGGIPLGPRLRVPLLGDGLPRRGVAVVP